MIWHSSPAPTFLLIFSVISTFILAIHLFQKREMPEAKTLLVLMAAAAVWCFTYMLELGSTGLTAKLFWAKVKYFGILLVPPSWLILTLQYTGRDKWLKPRFIVLLGIMPIANLALVWTGRLHSLYWTDAIVHRAGSFSVLALPVGPAFLVCAAYSYLLVLIGVVLILQAFMRSNPLYRKQATTMLLAALLPWVGNFMFLSGWSPLPHLDLAPFAFIATCFLCAWALFRLGLLDLVPIAHASIVDGIEDCIIVLDRQNRLVECNPSAQQLIKPAYEELIGRPIQEVMPELTLQFDPSSRSLAATEDVELGEGDPMRIHELRLSPLADRKGFQIGKVLVLRDVTKHRFAEKTIKEQNKFLENVVESLAHPFYVLDAEDYTIRLANSAARLADSSDTVTCYSLTHGNDRPCDAAGHPCPLKQVKRTKQPMVIEHVHEQKNGSAKHFQVHGYPILDSEGAVVQMIEYNLDITERRRMEEALRESEARLRAAIESLPFDFFILDNTGRYVMQNTACKRRWGNIIGKRPEDLGVCQENLSLWKKNNETAFRGGTVQAEVRIKRGAEEGCYYNVVAPILDQGNVKGILGVNIDITERKESEEALRKSEAQYRELSGHLEEKVKEKAAELRQTESLAAMGRMVSVVAHEVRIPLQSIGMGVDLLNIAIGQDETKKEILKEIKYGVDTLNTIIDELLNYSRPVKLEPAPVRVQDLINQSLSLVVEKVKHVWLSVELEQPGTTIVVDPIKLVQVLVNLLNNAADGMPEGGNLSIRSSTTERGCMLHLVVSDTGRGIDAERLEKIFEPFFTTKSRGTGLGLSVCKKIVEAHHGTICIRSTVGEGTTAEIALPVAGTPL